MTLEMAVRFAEILLGFALLQQSLELLRSYGLEKKLALLRAPLAILLMLGIYPVWVETALLASSILLIKRFQGPYNGGSDTMSILVLLCLWLANLAPSPMWQEIALGYLALQLTLSYFQSGLVKIENAEWRSGKALREVFALTAYPVSESLRSLANRPQLLLNVSRAVILGELLFPLTLLHSITLTIALVFAGVFHLANAVLFGLNRFVWSWLAAYPSVIWLQGRFSEMTW
ncbi:HTTM domain-containing protein [Cellvibrio sp. KY-GH-1]|uniref:HTTM domain-containing protein n=1 Tax=Cellvibrio sp. KY-GH-1 TaxID=2303332 RepID=UPI001249283E|nr:HTTM domain-containing protein [Cellvibrio sp. KY-GH-1]QEY14843.1 HTTM domain-containing protein [Cellvibrio sp. KY-GH-1]